MGFVAIGKENCAALVASLIRPAALSLAGLTLCGCTISGGGLEDMVDHGITTGSIARPAAPPADAERLSDGRTVRNAVSAANLSEGMKQPLPWANADTGTSGTISQISEIRSGAAICRSFTTSRQRFDGVALYAGEACTTGAGEWTLTRFAESS